MTNIIVIKERMSGNTKKNNNYQEEGFMLKIGFLTSGGDCQALNGAMRGTVKALYTNSKDKVQIYGIKNGYTGLINGDFKKLDLKDFENILNLGGTILGTSRQPFKKINNPDEKGRNKVKCMIENYKNMQLDCLVVLGGNGSHKTANLLSESGLNVVTLPKTIDNDINGTEISFGFQSAIDIATRNLDELHSTAASHSRVFIAELMGHKTGWLTLHAGIAGNADIILIPEIPYDIQKVKKAINKKTEEGKNYIIIAAAEGIISKEDSKLSKKELKAKRKADGFLSAGYRLEAELNKIMDREVRVTVPGHVQRGGNPCAYDRVLTSRLGAKAAELILNKEFGRMVSVVNNQITSIPLSQAVEKTKMVETDDEIIKQVKMLGICLGD